MNSVRMMSCLMMAWLCSACTVAPKPQPRLMTIQPPVLVRVMSISSPSVVSTIEVEATIPDSFDQSAWQLLQVRGVKVATDSKAPYYVLSWGCYLVLQAVKLSMAPISVMALICGSRVLYG